MITRARWLTVVGTIILALGLYLSFTRQTQFYPSLVLVIGCLF